MPTVNNIIGGVRLYLRMPPEDKLSNGMIAEYLLDKITYYLNELNLTDQNWLLEKWMLTVTALKDTYLVLPSSAPWGRPILCETVDQSDPFHIRREIPIIDLQDRLLRYTGYQTSLSAAVPPYTAASMSFFSEGGQKKVKLDPAPQAAAQYRFWFEPSRLLPQAFADDTRVLENFSNLLKVDVALIALPDCEWDEVKNERIEKALISDLTRYSMQFDKYKYQDRQEQTNTKRGFGDDWDMSDY